MEILPSSYLFYFFCQSCSFVFSLFSLIGGELKLRASVSPLIVGIPNCTSSILFFSFEKQRVKRKKNVIVIIIKVIIIIMIINERRGLARASKDRQK